MTSELPPRDVVGGRAATIGSSSHLNDETGDAAIVVAFAMCAFSGFVVGLLLGLLLA